MLVYVTHRALIRSGIVIYSAANIVVVSPILRVRSGDKIVLNLKGQLTPNLTYLFALF